jgi:hypothetical protein
VTALQPLCEKRGEPLLAPEMPIRPINPTTEEVLAEFEEFT